MSRKILSRSSWWKNFWWDGIYWEEKRNFILFYLIFHKIWNLKTLKSHSLFFNLTEKSRRTEEKVKCEKDLAPGVDRECTNPKQKLAYISEVVQLREMWFSIQYFSNSNIFTDEVATERDPGNKKTHATSGDDGRL